MAKKSNPFYDSEREKFERKRDKLKAPITKLKEQEKARQKEIEKVEGKKEKPKSLAKQFKEKHPKLTTPLLKVKPKDLPKYAQPIIKKKDIKKSKWTTPLLKQKYSKEKYSPEKQKQLRRLHRFINEAEKRGYVFNDNIIDTSLSAEELAQIKPKDLYKQAKFYDEKSGEILTGEKGRELENYRRLQKTQETKKKKLEEALIDIATDEENIAQIIDDNIIEDIDQIDLDIEQQELERDRAIKQGQEEYRPKELSQRAEILRESLNEQFKESHDTKAELDKLDLIREKLALIPDAYYRTSTGIPLELEAYRQSILKIWDDAQEKFIYDFHGEPVEKAIQYFRDFVEQSRIQELIDELFYLLEQSGQEENIKSCCNDLLNEIQGVPLSMEQAQYFEGLNESLNTWQTEDYE